MQGFVTKQVDKTDDLKKRKREEGFQEKPSKGQEQKRTSEIMKYYVGEIVIAKDPWRGNLSPAYVLANVGGGDYILNQITSKKRDIEIRNSDLRLGRLIEDPSYFKVGSLWTTTWRSIDGAPVAEVNDETRNYIRRTTQDLF